MCIQNVELFQFLRELKQKQITENLYIYATLGFFTKSIQFICCDTKLNNSRSVGT